MKQILIASLFMIAASAQAQQITKVAEANINVRLITEGQVNVRRVLTDLQAGDYVVSLEVNASAIDSNARLQVVKDSVTIETLNLSSGSRTYNVEIGQRNGVDYRSLRLIARGAVVVTSVRALIHEAGAIAQPADPRPDIHHNVPPDFRPDRPRHGRDRHRGPLFLCIANGETVFRDTLYQTFDVRNNVFIGGAVASQQACLSAISASRGPLTCLVTGTNTFRDIMYATYNSDTKQVIGQSSEHLNHCVSGLNSGIGPLACVFVGTNTFRDPLFRTYNLITGQFIGGTVSSPNACL